MINPKIKIMQCPDYTQLARSFEAQGYVLTDKRKIVAEYVCGKEEFTSIEEVWMALRGRQKVSLATVFLSIQLLKRLGYIEQVFNKRKRLKAYKWNNNIAGQKKTRSFNRKAQELSKPQS